MHGGKEGTLPLPEEHMPLSVPDEVRENDVSRQ